MNGIEHHFGVLVKHAKHLKLTFTFISLVILFAISCIALLANIAHAQEGTPAEEGVLADSETPPEEGRSVAESSDGTSSTTPAETTDATPDGLSPETEGVKTTGKDLRPVTEEGPTTEQQAPLSDQAQNRIRNLAANISNRMEAAIKRLENIAIRLDSRIVKLEAQNFDTTSARPYVEEAKAELTQAKLLIIDIDKVIGDVTGSETPRSAWNDGRKIYSDVRVHLVNTQAALRNAIIELRSARRPDNTEAAETTTATSGSETLDN